MLEGMILILFGILPSSTTTLSKVEATSCCKAAAAVCDITAVLLLCSKKHKLKAFTNKLPVSLLA